MWFAVGLAELALFVVAPLGIILLWVEVSRGRVLSPRPATSFMLFAALVAVSCSYALYFLHFLAFAMLGFFASYPSRALVILNAGVCAVGFVLALLGRGRFPPLPFHFVSGFTLSLDPRHDTSVAHILTRYLSPRANETVLTQGWRLPPSPAPRAIPSPPNSTASPPCTAPPPPPATAPPSAAATSR
jgi:hypothetical protein